jgi:hypothetical protein
MADERGDRPGDGQGDGPGALYTMAVVGGLGFEFVGLVVGGALVGMWVDGRLEVAPAGLLTGVGLGVMSAAWHTWKLARRLLRSERGDGDDTSGAG